MPKTTVKYPGEARGAFGVAVVKSHGNLKGVRAAPFFYSEKKILGIPAYKKAEKAELARVKELKGQWGKPGDGYEARFGTELVDNVTIWESELKKKMNGPLKTICITDVIDHIICESKKIYAGKFFHFFFFHFFH
eukprot:Lithocolla_globosa_v1_NODE_207_length_5169_cov_7.885329.p5 type:complete len:135 gc:universal NODE_207_length_5169_cov_7.885329:1510-1914(+)